MQNRLFELNQACFYQTPARIIKDDERLKALLGISDSTLQFISLLREKRQDVYQALFKQHQSIIASLSYTLGRNILTKLKNTSVSVSLVEAIQQGIITCSTENIGEDISSIEFLKKLSTVTANQHVFIPWSVLVACQLGVASVELVCHFKEGSRVAATYENKFTERYHDNNKKKPLYQPYVYSLKGKFDYKISLKIQDNIHDLYHGILNMGNQNAYHGIDNHDGDDQIDQLSLVKRDVVDPINLWTNKELFIKSQVASSSLTEANLNYSSFEAAFVTEILNQLHTQAHQLRPNIGQVFNDTCNQALQHGQADDKSYETLFESLAVIQKTSALIGGLIGLNESDSLALLTYFKTDWSAIMNHLDTLQSDATKAAFTSTLESVSELSSHIYRDMQGTQLYLQELRSNIQMYHRYNIYRENWIALSQALLRMKLPFQALMKLNGNGSDQVHDDFLQLQNALEDTRLVLNEAYQPLHLTFSTLLSVEDTEDGFSQDTAVKTEHLSEIMAQQTALMDFDMMTFKTLLGEMTQYFGDMAVVINRPILLMGRSKAAKTTVANFLCGVDFLKTEEGLIPLSEARGIGQTGLSETDYPEWFITESGLNIIDNPGVDDNRGTEEDIIGAISTQIRAKQYQDIKNIVFACPYSDIMEDSYTANLINAFFTIGSLFKYQEDIAKHLKLAVTFLDGDVSSDQETVSAIIKRLKRWQQTTLAGLRNVKKSAIITHVLDALTEQNIYCVHPDIAHTRAKLLDGFFDGDDVMDKANVNFTHYSCALSKFRSVSDSVIKYEQALITAMTTLTTAVFGAIYKRLPDIKTCLFDEKASMITRDFMDIHQQLIDNRQQFIEFLSPYQLQMSGNTSADSYQVLKITLQEWTACQAIFDEFKRLLAIINGQTASSQNNAFFQRRSASNESVANDLNL